MKLLIWLWNPWVKYDNTRHNIWFMYLDYFKEKNSFSEFREESKFKAEISSWNYKWEKILLVKPLTYMNLSWESVRALLNFYKLDYKEDICVIFDDISMDFWKTRFREKGSSWWQNWVKNIILHSWEEFSRVKLWVWNNPKYDLTDWVLSKFTQEENNDMDNFFSSASSLLDERFF